MSQDRPSDPEFAKLVAVSTPLLDDALAPLVAAQIVPVGVADTILLLLQLEIDRSIGRASTRLECHRTHAACALVQRNARGAALPPADDPELPGPAFTVSEPEGFTPSHEGTKKGPSNGAA